MAFAAAGAEYCDGAVGDGTSDQFQYYLYYRYEAEAVGDSGVGRLWLCVCFYYCFVCVYQAFLFRKKIKDGDHLQSLQDGFRLFCCYEIVPDCLQLRDIIFHQAGK